MDCRKNTGENGFWDLEGFRMIRLSGKAVYKGIVLGTVAVFKKNDQQVERKKIADTDAEIFRLGKAGEQTKIQLQKLYVVSRKNQKV